MANVLNLVVLTAALSVYNSCVLLQQPHAVWPGWAGQRPQGAAQDQQERCALTAITISAATLLCVLINYLIPGKAFGLLMSLVVSAWSSTGP